MKDIKQEVAKELLETIKSAKEFTAEQAPDVANQMLAWGLWENGLTIVVGALVSIAGVFWMRWVRSKINIDEHADDLIGHGLGSNVAAVCGFFASVVAAYNVIYINVAPKVWLLERLADMASK